MKTKYKENYYAYNVTSFAAIDILVQLMEIKVNEVRKISEHAFTFLSNLKIRLLRSPFLTMYKKFSTKTQAVHNFYYNLITATRSTLHVQQEYNV